MPDNELDEIYTILKSLKNHILLLETKLNTIKKVETRPTYNNKNEDIFIDEMSTVYILNVLLYDLLRNRKFLEFRKEFLVELLSRKIKGYISIQHLKKLKLCSDTIAWFTGQFWGTNKVDKNSSIQAVKLIKFLLESDQSEQYYIDKILYVLIDHVYATNQAN
jgi:hypothetical protein